MKKFIAIIILSGLFCAHAVHAQNVGINATGAVPNSSAMLDVSSVTSGVLVPRMTHIQMNAIAAPATGLLVYDTNAPAGFYYYDGTQWRPILSTANSANGGWSVIGNAGTVDGVNFLGTTDSAAFSIRVNNQKAGRIDPGLKNTFFGYKAGFANSTGSNNFFGGQYAGVGNTTGSHNIAIGNNALRYNTGFSDMFAIGDSALYAPVSGDLFAIGNRAGKNNTSGFRNFFLGNDAGYNTTSGFYNMFVGAAAGYNNTSGTYNYVFGRATLFLNKTSNLNIAFGREAGYTHQAGDNNIFIGQFAGQFDSSGVENTIVGNYAAVNNYTGKFLTCLGFSSGSNNTSGNYNTFLGHLSGNLNTSGGNNTFAGGKSGLNNSTGANNTLLGYLAGQTITTGSSNTFIGYQADGTATLTNAAAIGANATVTANNSLVLGGTGINAVSVGIGVTAPLATLEVNGYTMLGTNAPAVKMVKFTSTSAAVQGGSINIPHGLVLGKILAVDVLMDYGGGVIPPSYKGSAGYEYNVYVTATDVVVWNQAANSSNILSRPVRVLITYEQ